MSGGGGGGAVACRNIGTYQDVFVNAVDINGPWIDIDLVPRGGGYGARGTNPDVNAYTANEYECLQYNLVSLMTSTLTANENNQLVSTLMKPIAAASLNDGANVQTRALLGSTELTNIGTIQDIIYFNNTIDSDLGTELCVLNEGQLRQNTVYDFVGTQLKSFTETRTIQSVRFGLSPSETYNAIYFTCDLVFATTGPYEWSREPIIQNGATADASSVKFYSVTNDLSSIAPDEFKTFQDLLYSTLVRTVFSSSPSFITRAYPLESIPTGKTLTILWASRTGDVAQFGYDDPTFSYNNGDCVTITGLTGLASPLNTNISRVFTSSGAVLGNTWFGIRLPGDDVDKVIGQSGTATILRPDSTSSDYVRSIWPSPMSVHTTVKRLSVANESQYLRNFMLETFQTGVHSFTVPEWATSIRCYLYGAGGSSVTTTEGSSGDFVSGQYVNLSGGTMTIKVGYGGGSTITVDSELYGGSSNGISYGGGLSSVEYKAAKFIAGGGGGRGLGQKNGLHGIATLTKGMDGEGGAGGSGFKGGDSSTGLGGNGSSLFFTGKMSKNIQTQKYFVHLGNPGLGGLAAASNGAVALEIYS
jgi:hypothetical protein